jgi:hypothetical protein
MTASRTLLLLLLIPLLTACDGSRVLEPSAIQGEWRIVQPASGNPYTVQSMVFRPDGTFGFELLWYGFHGSPPTTLTGYARTVGEYRLDGERLLWREHRSEHWQMYAAGPNPSVSVVSRPEWTEYGTVRVRGDRLFHTFTSAPADAPITTTMVYERVR